MNPLVAGGLVFATSGAVLVLEILAVRLVAPYVGITIETYTAVIGTVLAGIAGGTWLGGRLADRLDPRRMLGPLLAAGGGLAAATVPVVRVVGGGVEGGSGSVIGLAAAAFLAPAAVLSAVTPTVVKLQLRDLTVTGRVVGRLSALGTAGAILGTFLAGFVLVERVATSTAILAVAGALVVAGGALWWHGAVTRRRAARATLAAVAVAALGLAATAGRACDTETAYHCVRIVEDGERPGGRLLFLDTVRHSYVDLDDPTHLEFRYTGLFAAALAAQVRPGPVAALHVGGGGFTMPRYVEAVRPGSANLVLEIDPGLVDVATSRLGLRPGPGLEVRVGDGRLLVRDVPGASHDVVFGDAFGHLAVPWHLTTREFVAEVRAVLRPGGSYILNVIDYPPMRFARAQAATLARVFGHVAVIAPPAFVAPGGNAGGNVVLVASDRPLAGDALRAAIAERGGREVVLTGDEVAGFVDGAPVLTDEFAPVDQWLARSRGFR